MRRINGIVLFLLMMSCQNPSTSGNRSGSADTDSSSSGHNASGQASAGDSSRKVRLVTLDPGHFHAALVQKSMYADVDTVVHVYAPDGPDVKFHLDRVAGYNTRAQSPTHWKEIVYTGNDFFEKMVAEKAGNTVVLSGNNQEKVKYISGSLSAGFNVLADKPMVIFSKDFPLLEKAFSTAADRRLLLYDIMTERFEITTMLQREFSMDSVVFGQQQKGSAASPGIVMTSAHHFYKQVSGITLTRPAWFFDPSQQGGGLVDVMTHLVDLVQWAAFPDQAIDYRKDIKVHTGKYWPTPLSLSQFRDITKLDSFPPYLRHPSFPTDHASSSTGNTRTPPARLSKSDTMLQVNCNGEIGYQLKGVNVRTSAIWTYKDPATADDTYYSLMRGTKADLVIRQGAEEQFRPTLYIEPVAVTAAYEKMLTSQIKNIQTKYPGIELKKIKKGWEIIIPEKYKEGHEAHFARVTQNFLTYLKEGNMPAWEIPGMIAKYYTTTKALEIAQQNRKTIP